MELGQFEGRWQLTRDIRDLRAGETGRLEGEAVFAPDAYGLTYSEVGTLNFAGRAPMQATRRYLWRRNDAGIVVLFEDGRDFHIIDGSTAEHLCGEDTYKVAYDFAAFPRWSSIWHVRGPRKDYVMKSFYTRA